MLAVCSRSASLAPVACMRSYWHFALTPLCPLRLLCPLRRLQQARKHSSRRHTPAPVNDAPVVVNQAYGTTLDATLTVSAANGLLYGSSDVDGDAVWVFNNTAPMAGSVSVARSGAFVYVPLARFVGSDSFRFVITDGQGGMAMGLVNITVGARVTDGRIQLPAGTWLLLSAGWGWGQCCMCLGLTHPQLKKRGLTPGLKTEVCRSSGQSQRRLPPSTGVHPACRPLPETQNRPCCTAAVNRAPVAASQAYAFNEDDTLVVPAANGLLRGAIDPDGFPIEVINTTSPANGKLTAVARNGAFSYVPNTNFNGLDSFTFWAGDGRGDPGKGSVSLSVGATGCWAASRRGTCALQARRRFGAGRRSAPLCLALLCKPPRNHLHSALSKPQCASIIRQ